MRKVVGKHEKGPKFLCMEKVERKRKRYATNNTKNIKRVVQTRNDFRKSRQRENSKQAGTTRMLRSKQKRKRTSSQKRAGKS